LTVDKYRVQPLVSEDASGSMASEQEGDVVYDAEGSDLKRMYLAEMTPRRAKFREASACFMLKLKDKLDIVDEADKVK